ncbi:hypothetical protein Tco_1564357 [Tanacetum coccineum]
MSSLVPMLPEDACTLLGFVSSRIVLATFPFPTQELWLLKKSEGFGVRPLILVLMISNIHSTVLSRLESFFSAQGICHHICLAWVVFDLAFIITKKRSHALAHIFNSFDVNMYWRLLWSCVDELLYIKIMSPDFKGNTKTAIQFQDLLCESPFLGDHVSPRNETYLQPKIRTLKIWRTKFSGLSKLELFSGGLRGSASDFGKYLLARLSSPKWHDGDLKVPIIGSKAESSVYLLLGISNCVSERRSILEKQHALSNTILIEPSFLLTKSTGAPMGVTGMEILTTGDAPWDQRSLCEILTFSHIEPYPELSAPTMCSGPMLGFLPHARKHQIPSSWEAIAVASILILLSEIRVQSLAPSFLISFCCASIQSSFIAFSCSRGSV